jgi:hypothetical protein
MSTEQVYVVISKLCGFSSIHKTIEEANESKEVLMLNNKYKDEFEVIDYNIYNRTEEISKSDTVYVLISVNNDLPLLVTRDKEEFEKKHEQFLTLVLTYPEPSSFWSHIL